MALYKAQYSAPKKSGLASGEFEFESGARSGSKDNLFDARMKLIEILGNSAPICSITKVEKV